VGPLLTGTVQVKFLVVVVDYFIEWVEAEALAAITKKKIEFFF
jgi:hypothetical protein